MTTSFPPSLFGPSGGGSVSSPRTFRLIDAQGEPHPVLDDLYESAESAWSEANRWWKEQAEGEEAPMGIGMEVSTRCGGWRTLRPPGGC